MTQGKWKTIPEFPNYEVSTEGRVRRSVSSGRGVAGTILKAFTSVGYPCVNLCRPEGRKKLCVHRLVAEAFIERPEGAREVNHIDASRTNNRVENLEWVTPSGNRLHAYRFGNLSAKGERNGNAKINEAAVMDMRASADSPEVLAARHGCSVATVFDVLARRTWAHV